MTVKRLTSERTLQLQSEESHYLPESDSTNSRSEFELQSTGDLRIYYEISTCRLKRGAEELTARPTKAPQQYWVAPVTVKLGS